MTSPSIAVVGAGAVGCLVAREIASRAPGSPVTVLDRDSVGSGATRRSAALHIPRGGSERVRQMSAFSQRYYESLAADLPPGLIFPLRTTVVARPTSAAAISEQYLPVGGLARATRLPAPGILLPPGSDLWELDGCQYADAYALAQTIADRLRPRVSFREGVRVTGVEADDEGVFLHLGTGEALRVDRAVLAPGPWIHDAAWRHLVAPLGLRVKKIVALHVEQRPAEGAGAVVFADEDAFLLPLRHRGHWLYSYTCQEWDMDPDAAAEGLSPANLAEARESLRRHAPAFAEQSLAGRVFYDAYSPDREPVVRAIDRTGRVILAGAANGSGYRLAPAMAAEAALLAAAALAPPGDVPAVAHAKPAGPRSPR